MLAHEVDRVGRHHLRCHDQIAFVLAILVVENDDHLAGTNIDDRLFDGIERTATLGKMLAQRGKELRQARKGAVRRLAAPGAQQRYSGFRQTGRFGHLGGGHRGLVHRGVEEGGKTAHTASLALDLTFVKVERRPSTSLRMTQQGLSSCHT